jgi:hypothetical protein
VPRRRRGANVAAIEAATERGLVMRVLLRSPKDMVAGALAFAAVGAIIANALFLQAGHHPAPMFGSVTAIPAAAPALVSPLPRPRPNDVVMKPADTPEPKPVESKAADPMANLVKVTTAAPAAPSTIARPPAPIPVATANPPGLRKVAAVQRTLTEYGYGQLKQTGTVGADTQAAIQKFERERKIPITGQMSDRLVRELTAMTGKPID